MMLDIYAIETHLVNFGRTIMKLDTVKGIFLSDFNVQRISAEHFDLLFQSFIYLGCGGNGNRFVHPADCETFCRIMGDGRPNETLASWESTSQLPSESVIYD